MNPQNLTTTNPLNKTLSTAGSNFLGGIKTFASNLFSGVKSLASVTTTPGTGQNNVAYTPQGLPTISQTAPAQNMSMNTPIPAPVVQPAAVAAPQATTIPQNTPIPSAAPIITPPQTTFSTKTPTPLINIDTSKVPSNILGSNITPNNVLNYRNNLQQQFDAVNNAQQNLYGLQGNAVQAGLYSPQEIQALQQQMQDNQAYRQGTLDIRGKPIPMEFQTGQQQQLDLQHQLTSQADTENAALQEQLRQNNLQAAQANAQFGQQNYQNAFGQLQQQQQNQIAQGQLGISQQQTNISGQNSAFGRYDYQQITDPNTGLPSIATIDKTTGQVVGTYSPQATTGGQQGTTTDPTVAFSNALIGQESGGNYQAVSPVGALGKYQIMPATLQGLGINVSPQDFLSNPQLQDQAFQALLGQLSQQYGGDPAKIAAAYYGGANGAAVVGTPAGDAPQKGGFPSINSYVNSVLQKTQAGLSTGQDQLPPLVQKYLIPQGVQGVDNTQYINEDKVPASQLAAVKNQAAQSGIPILNSDEVAKIRNIDVTKQNLSQMQSTITNILGSGVLGRVGSSAKNIISSITQSNPDVAAFNNYRTVAINALQGLGAGQGGARITVGEIKAATDNLPLITDNIETANTKLSIVNSFLDKWTKELIPNSKSSQSQTSSGSNNDPLGLGI